MKRGLRILPALFVVVILSAFVLGPLVSNLSLAEYFASPVLLGYLRNILLNIRYSLPGVFENNIYPHAVNGSLWTLPVEATMYLFVLLLGVVTFWSSSRMFTAGWVLLTVIFLATAVIRIHFVPDLFQSQIIWGMLVTAFLDVAPYFMVGGCLFLFAGIISHSLAAAAILVLASYLLTGVFVVFGVLNILILSYAIVVFGTSSTPYLRKAGRFGDLSYGVYLYGFPVAQTLSWAFGRDMSFLAHIILSLGISMIFAFASWHLVEKKALRLKHSVSLKKRPTSS